MLAVLLFYPCTTVMDNVRRACFGTSVRSLLETGEGKGTCVTAGVVVRDAPVTNLYSMFLMKL